MLPKACAKTAGAVLLDGFYVEPKAAAVLKKRVVYLSLESPIKSSNDDGFPSVCHHLTELHDVWELEEGQKQRQEEEEASLRSGSSSTCPGHKKIRAMLPLRGPQPHCPQPAGTKGRV